MSNTVHLKIFTDATTPDKAKKVLDRVLKTLAIDHISEKIEPFKFVRYLTHYAF